MNRMNFTINPDYDERHFKFQRRQRLYTPPLEKTQPLESWPSVIAGGFLVAISIFFLISFLFAVL